MAQNLPLQHLFRLVQPSCQNKQTDSPTVIVICACKSGWLPLVLLPNCAPFCGQTGLLGHVKKSKTLQKIGVCRDFKVGMETTVNANCDALDKMHLSSTAGLVPSFSIAFYRMMLILPRSHPWSYLLANKTCHNVHFRVVISQAFLTEHMTTRQHNWVPEITIYLHTVTTLDHMSWIQILLGSCHSVFGLILWEKLYHSYHSYQTTNNLSKLIEQSNNLNTLSTFLKTTRS